MWYVQFNKYRERDREREKEREGAAYVGCYALVLRRVVAVSARGKLASLLERLPERPMASALIEELKTVISEAKRS